MIISKTPLRISFVGGATDLKAFYKYHTGMVISTAIDKYMYVVVNKRFKDDIRLSYTKTEIVDRPDQLEHDLVKEALKRTGITSGIEINTIADVPGQGTGLGSSSSLIVGLLNALYAFKGRKKSIEQLAKEACQIEIDVLSKPIGKQDQYIAAYGGLNHIIFNKNGRVDVKRIPIKRDTKNKFDSNLLLFYIDKTRKSDNILTEQKNNTENKAQTRQSLIKMRDLVEPMKKCLINQQLDRAGELLHQNWIEKKQLANTIANQKINFLYQEAIKAGALGGKICGAGGGGFLLFYCQKGKQDKVRKALRNLKEMPFSFESKGSKIIYQD